LFFDKSLFSHRLFLETFPESIDLNNDLFNITIKSARLRPFAAAIKGDTIITLRVQVERSFPLRMTQEKTALSQRFRGYLPIIVDIETSGFDPATNALLEIAAVIPAMDRSGRLAISETYASAIKPFPGAKLNLAALSFNRIDPSHPERRASEEKEALQDMFQLVKEAVKRNGCTRAILVGHNPAFDIGFLNAAVERTRIKKNPFHPFCTFDTATLCGLVYGQTVLAKAAHAAGMDWDNSQAHSAAYDAEQTARLFCGIVNRWENLVASEKQFAGKLL
jgi:ribonuclease T